MGRVTGLEAKRLTSRITLLLKLRSACCIQIFPLLEVSFVEEISCFARWNSLGSLPANEIYYVARNLI